MTLSWNECQERSDEILSEGSWLLKNLHIQQLDQISVSPGVYLISNDGMHFYAGQALQLTKRVKQHLSSERSTFYKAYLKKYPQNDNRLEINDFEIRSLVAGFGRKELEEFCMVNLNTKLNKFHTGKRHIFEVAEQNGIWEDVQAAEIHLLEEGAHNLFQAEPSKWTEAKVSVGPGIYFVRDKLGQLIYVGESTDVNRRHHMHSNRTYISALRRHIGTEILGFNFVGKRSFSKEDDIIVSEYLSQCTISHSLISIGRLELEEYIIQKHKPILNRKSKKAA